MLRGLFRFALAAAVALTVSSADAAKLSLDPYLQDMTTDSVVIMWRTDEPAASWVELRAGGGEAPIVYTCTIPTTRHQMRVPDLKPNMHYTYRVGVSADEPLTDAIGPFQTFSDSDTWPFDFVAFGDHRNFPDDHRAVVEAIVSKSKEIGWPRFVLDTGDYTGDGENATDFYKAQFFDPGHDLLERVCYFPVIGNHEAPRAIPRIPMRYFEYFEVPTHNSGTEYYYSFDYGPAHFAMVDVYSTDYAEGSKEWEWIRRDLRTSKAKWKFVAMHYPVYIHRTAPSVTYGNEEIRKNLVPLFKEFGVTAVFSGDSHFYQRSEVDGIHYVCTGGAGAPLYTPGDADYVRASKKVHHYCRIRIDGNTMKLTAYDRDNNVIDEMESGPALPEVAEAPKLNLVRSLPTETMKAGEAIVIESKNGEGELAPPSVYTEGGGMMDSSAKSLAEGLEGKGTRFSDNTEGGAMAMFKPAIDKAGKYLISITVPDAPSISAPNTLFEIASPGSDTITGKLDMEPGVMGDKWYDIGLFDLAPGATFKMTEAPDEAGRFYADAVKFTRYE